MLPLKLNFECYSWLHTVLRFNTHSYDTIHKLKLLSSIFLYLKKVYKDKKHLQSKIPGVFNYIMLKVYY